MTGPRALLMVMLDVDPSIDEEEFNRWYFAEHLAERLACPGVLSARRFRAVAGRPRYLALYELERPEALETPEYRSLARSRATGNSVDQPRGSARTFAMLEGFRNPTRNIYLEVGPPLTDASSVTRSGPEPPGSRGAC